MLTVKENIVVLYFCSVFLSVSNSHLIASLSADSTGTHSLYTTYKDYEIMFHVSTMLPYTPNNKQQVSTLLHNTPAYILLFMSYSRNNIKISVFNNIFLFFK